MKTELYNVKNEKVGTVDLPEKVFGLPWKPALVKQVLEAQLSNRRRPVAHAKGRSEVRGGGRKPWRQKGTGRARHGSIRSPLWIGGGKAHGPSKERSYEKKINKKMRRLAVLSVLSRKLKEGEVKIFDSLALEAPKTKKLYAALKDLTPLRKKAKKFDVLLVPDVENKNLYRAAANLPKTKVLDPRSLNVYDLMNYKNIFMDQGSIPVIEKQYLPK